MSPVKLDGSYCKCRASDCTYIDRMCLFRQSTTEAGLAEGAAGAAGGDETAAAGATGGSAGSAGGPAGGAGGPAPAKASLLQKLLSQ